MMCATRGSSRLLCTGSAVPGGPDGQSLVPAVYRLCQHATIKTECAGGGGAAAGVDATAGGAPIVRVIRLRQAFCTMLQCALPIGAGPGLLLRFALHRGLSAAARRRYPPAQGSRSGWPTKLAVARTLRLQTRTSLGGHCRGMILWPSWLHGVPVVASKRCQRRAAVPAAVHERASCGSRGRPASSSPLFSFVRPSPWPPRRPAGAASGRKPSNAS